MAPRRSAPPGRPARPRAHPAHRGTEAQELAYAISSFFGGLSGAIFVAISQSIYPSSFVVQDIYLREVKGNENKVVGIASKTLADPGRGCKM